jgi:hypothetical protein
MSVSPGRVAPDAIRVHAPASEVMGTLPPQCAMISPPLIRRRVTDHRD